MKLSLPAAFQKLCFLSLLFILVFVSWVPAKAGGALEKSPPGFRDGEWIGNFSMVSSMKTDVMNMTSSYKGEMGLISSGGQVKGEWTLSGFSSYAGDITGAAVFDGAGKVSGTSIEPLVSTSSFVAHMDITVAGMHTTQDVDMGSGGNMPLTLVSSTCSQVIGDIQAPANNSISQSGMSGSASGSFVATRVDDLQGANKVEYQQQVGDLLEATEALKQKAMDGGGIDFQSLNDLVSKAENLQTAIKKNTECGQLADKQFLTVITGTMIDLAYFALSKPELFTTGELNRILMAALSVGAMGSGAVDSQVAADLLAKFTQEFTDRLGDAESNKNCMEATQIKLAGAALNNGALQQQADQVMTAVCGG